MRSFHKLLFVKPVRHNFSLFLHPQSNETYFFSFFFFFLNKPEILMQTSDLSRKKTLKKTVRADITRYCKAWQRYQENSTPFILIQSLLGSTVFVSVCVCVQMHTDLHQGMCSGAWKTAIFVLHVCGLQSESWGMSSSWSSLSLTLVAHNGFLPLPLSYDDTSGNYQALNVTQNDF